MKKTLLFILIAGSYWSKSQELIGVSGGTFTQPSGSISFSVGEPIIFSHENSGTNLSQGFQQGEKLSVTSLEEFETDFKVYPNPVSNQLNIGSEIPDGFTYQLSDLNGKVLIDKKSSGMSSKIYFDGLSKGIYILKLITKDQKTTKSFKITKH